MASIVEKEGVIGKNLGPVARVILNRLARNMPLQMDSTVLYSEGRDGGPVTAADLALQHPVQHLPQQGAHPDPDLLPVRGRPRRPPSTRPPGPWLYFVVVEQDGTEAFADTFAQQQANEALAKQRGLGLTDHGRDRPVDRSAPRPPVGGHHGGRGDRGPGGPLALARCSTTRPSPTWGSTGCRWASRCRRAGPAQALDGARALGVRGLSVTMPHKDEAARHLARLSPLAARLGAVNCVVRRRRGRGAARTPTAPDLWPPSAGGTASTPPGVAAWWWGPGARPGR